jgi:hypothetical protein
MNETFECGRNTLRGSVGSLRALTVLKIKKEAFMRPDSRRTGTTMVIAVLAVAALCAQSAPGACSSLGGQIVPGRVAALQTPPVHEVDPSGLPAEEPEHGRRPLMTGLWKTVFVSGGAVINLGFNTWHSDGTEWALDSTPRPALGNVCPGVWERIGHRTYATVHPAFNYDPSGVNVESIFIERLSVTISPDGNTFHGTFTWDSYDFEGNLLSGSVAGTLTGTRIKVGPAFPFPFPH